MRKRNSNYLIIGLVIFVLVLTGAYALLSQTLDISGTATGTGNFKVEFSNASVSDTEKADYTITNNSTTLNINSTLEYPGDSVTINFTIRNTGNLAARVNALTINDNSNIDFTVNVVGLSNIEGTVLGVGETTTGSIVVTWNSTATTSNPEDVNFSVNLDYIQATT